MLIIYLRQELNFIELTKSKLDFPHFRQQEKGYRHGKPPSAVSLESTQNRVLLQRLGLGRGHLR
jgi:hypothetical protein